MPIIPPAAPSKKPNPKMMAVDNVIEKSSIIKLPNRYNKTAYKSPQLAPDNQPCLRDLLATTTEAINMLMADTAIVTPLEAPSGIGE